MKAIKVLLVTACIIAFGNAHVRAQAFAVKSHKLTVKGTSSLHDWESSVEKFESKGSFILTDNTLADISAVVATIPVKSLKSTKGKIMDNKTYEAFNVEKNPFIVFTFSGEKIFPAKNVVEVSGTLNMAGVSKPVQLTLHYKILPGGDLHISGSKKLIMSDFKMEPPTAMMGTIKVGDEVEVMFELVITNTSNTL